MARLPSHREKWAHLNSSWNRDGWLWENALWTSKARGNKHRLRSPAFHICFLKNCSWTLHTLIHITLDSGNLFSTSSDSKGGNVLQKTQSNTYFTNSYSQPLQIFMLLFKILSMEGQETECPFKYMRSQEQHQKSLETLLVPETGCMSLKLTGLSISKASLFTYNL